MTQVALKDIELDQFVKDFTALNGNVFEENIEFLKFRKRVTVSCLNCQKNHCKCSFARPCLTCVKYGALCLDGVPKKRCF